MAQSQLDVIGQLANTLGGTSTTSNAGNTGALENALAQLAAQNNTGYEALLQSIFQQGAAQMSGFQHAYGNSIGARARGNSGTNAALSRLLKDTTVGAQGQIVAQQNANIGQQIQAGQAIAQATKGTNQQQGTNLGQAAQNLAILKLLSESGILKKGALSDLFGDSSETTDYGMVNPVDNFVARQPDYAGNANIPVSGTTTVNDFGSIFQQPQSQPQSYQSDSGMDLFPQSNTTNLVTPPDTYQSDIVPGLMPTDDSSLFQLPTIDYGEYFADGGEVPDMEDKAEEDAQTRYDPGHTTNRVLDILQKIINNDGKAQQSNFADGGSVTQRAAGGRRSSAPIINTTAPITSVADNTLPTQSAPNPNQTGGATPPAPTTLTPAQSVEITFNEGNNRGINAGYGTMSDSTRKTLGLLSNANSLSAITGGPSIPAFGLVSGLARARSPEDALSVVGTQALNTIAPGAGGLINMARDPSQVNAIDLAASLNPFSLTTNLGLGLFDTSIGKLALGSPQSVNPKTGDVTEATMGLVGGGGQFGGDPARTSPVTGWGRVDTTDLGSLGNIGGSSSGNSSSDSGRTSASNTGGDRGGNFANGGNVPGIQDNIKINVSPGEYIISKDVVDAIGVDFFDALQQALHTPASIQRAMA